jgi:hypothetical protein
MTIGASLFLIAACGVTDHLGAPPVQLLLYAFGADAQ